MHCTDEINNTILTINVSLKFLLTLWIYFRPRSVGVCVGEEAAGDTGGPLHVVVGEGAVADPVVTQALGTLPVRRRLRALRQRPLALVLGPVLLRIHLRAVAHHLGDLVLLGVPGRGRDVEGRDAGEAAAGGGAGDEVGRHLCQLLLPHLLLAVSERRPLHHQRRVLADQLIVVIVHVARLGVGHNQVKVRHFPELFPPNDGLLEVPDTDVVAITRDGLIVQVIFEFEPDRHCQGLF